MRNREVAEERVLGMRIRRERREACGSVERRVVVSIIRCLGEM